MIGKLKEKLFGYSKDKYPEFVDQLQVVLGLSHLSKFDFVEYIWWFCFHNYDHLTARLVEGFEVFDIPQLSTENIKVSVVLTKQGLYEEHMHEKSEACLMIIRGNGKIILEGIKKSLGYGLSRAKVFKVPKGVYHGFEVTSKTMVFVSIQCPPILEHGIEGIHFRS